MSLKAVKATISDPCNILLHLFAWSQVKLCHGGKSTVRDGGTKKTTTAGAKLLVKNGAGVVGDL